MGCYELTVCVVDLDKATYLAGTSPTKLNVSPHSGHTGRDPGRKHIGRKRTRLWRPDWAPSSFPNPFLAPETLAEAILALCDGDDSEDMQVSPFQPMLVKDHYINTNGTNGSADGTGPCRNARRCRATSRSSPRARRSSAVHRRRRARSSSTSQPAPFRRSARPPRCRGWTRHLSSNREHHRLAFFHRPCGRSSHKAPPCISSRSPRQEPMQLFQNGLATFPTVLSNLTVFAARPTFFGCTPSASPLLVYVATGTLQTICTAPEM